MSSLGRARSRICFDSADPPVVAHFWAALTGHRVALNEPELIRLEGDGYGLGDLVFVEVDGWKRSPNRVHVELVVDDVEHETRRAIELGATPVEEREAMGEYRLVLRDPEGNEFSLIRYAA